MFRVAPPWESTWGALAQAPQNPAELAAAVAALTLLSCQAGPAPGRAAVGGAPRGMEEELDAVTCLAMASTRARLAPTGLNSIFSQTGVGNPSILGNKGRAICIRSLTRVWIFVKNEAPIGSVFSICP